MAALAFALGNPLRRDDGVGVALGGMLREIVPDLPMVEAQELLPEHAEAIALADAVLFLDASEGGRPGTLAVSPLAPRISRPAIHHALLPEDLLGLALSLFGRAPPSVLITVAGQDFSFGEGLTPEVAAALPEALRTAREQALGFTSR